MQNLQSVKQVATFLNVSPSTVYALAEAGKLPHLRIGTRGGRLLFSPEAVEQWVRQQVNVTIARAT